MPIEREQAAGLLEALVSLVRVTRAIEHRDGAQSVAATPIAILKLVSETDPRLGDLAVQLRVKPSVASRAVAALEIDGYVIRDADPDDARACRVKITDEGREHLRNREEWALDMVARTLADWSPQDAAQSVRVLQRLERGVNDWVSNVERAVNSRTDLPTTPLINSPESDDEVTQENALERRAAAPTRTNLETTAV